MQQAMELERQMAALENLNPDVQAIAILIDDMRSVDPHARIASFRNLQLIAVALGPQRTRNELIPYVSEFADDDDDVMEVIAREIGNLAPCVGGRKYLHVLLDPLENIMASEEATVRKEAIASANKILSLMLPLPHPNPDGSRSVQSTTSHPEEPAAASGTASAAHPAPTDAALRERARAERAAMTLLKQLACSEWYTSRICAAALAPTIHQRVNNANASEIRAILTQLASDDTPMVRRAVAGALDSLIEKLLDLPSWVTQAPGDVSIDFKSDSVNSLDALQGSLANKTDFDILKARASELRVNEAGAAIAFRDLLPPVRQLAVDEQDSVRLLAVPAICSLLRACNGPEQLVHVIPAAMSLASDGGWRVRYVVASRFGQLMAALPTDVATSNTDTSFVAMYAQLLQDAEPEVRAAAAGRLGDVARLAGRELVSARLVPLLPRLVDDANDFVRVATANTIMELTTVLPRQDAQERILPQILRLLRDANPDVRLNLLAHLESVRSVVDLEVLSQSLIPAIVDLSRDKQWRIRRAVVRLVPRLAQQLGANFYEGRLSELCMSWVNDPVAEVREEATLNFARLAQTFGAAWAETHLVPRLLHISTRRTYVYRLICLLAIMDLAPLLGPEVALNRLMPIVLTLIHDTVPNVRLNVARALDRLADLLDADSVKRLAVPSLTLLATDADRDVKYYAEASLKRIQAKQEQSN